MQRLIRLVTAARLAIAEIRLSRLQQQAPRRIATAHAAVLRLQAKAVQPRTHRGVAQAIASAMARRAVLGGER